MTENPIDVALLNESITETQKNNLATNKEAFMTLFKALCASGLLFVRINPKFN